MQENLSLKAFVVLMKAQKSLEKMVKEDIAHHGMKVPEFTVLEALYHKGSQTVHEISRAVLINFGSITYVIDKLAAKGYIERRNCEEDRRVVYIDLTPSGKELMDRIFPKHQKMIEEAFSGLSDSDKTNFIKMLKTIGKGED